jgi:rhamnosyltransferase
MLLAKKKSPAVSVIMRTKNVDWVISEALSSLFQQQWTDFELIVIDSGSEDHTLTHLKAYPHRLIRIPPQNYYPGRVLNKAIAASRGELIVFQNADVVPLNAQALGNLLQPLHNNPAVQASFARQLPRPEAAAWVRRDYAAAFPDSGEAPPWMTYSLPFAAMRRSAWLQQPFYDWAWGSEDTEWGKRARQRGWQVAYAVNSLVMHSHNYTLPEIFGRRFIEGEADAWMQQQPYPLWRIPLRIIADTWRDWRATELKKWPQMCLSLPRRSVFHWAHYQGWHHGWQRLCTANADGAWGQQVVLDRHSSRQVAHQEASHG